MMKRVITKIGDVFRVDLKSGGARYLQYVANDMTQLNSEVLRVFKTIRDNSEAPNLDEIVRDAIDFHVHSDTRAGIKMQCWEKVGKAAVYGEVETLFRQARYREVGIPKIKVSTRWSVWYINQPMQYVGPLKGGNRKSERGSVFPPFAVVARMETGDYGFFEYAFE